MATTFKSWVTSGIDDSYVTVTPVVGAGKTFTVLGVSVFNVSGSANWAYLKLVKGGESAPNAEAHLAHRLELQAGTGYEFNEGNKHILEDGDALQCKAESGSNVLEVIVNYLEIS